MEEARRLRASSWEALASEMRLERIWAYSFCRYISMLYVVGCGSIGGTYGGVLGGLRATALECDAVALVLQALGGDQALDLGGLGVGLCALLLGGNLAADDELADLELRSLVYLYDV